MSHSHGHLFHGFGFPAGLFVGSGVFVGLFVGFGVPVGLLVGSGDPVGLFAGSGVFQFSHSVKISGLFAASFNGTGLHDGVLTNNLLKLSLYIWILFLIFGHVSGFTTLIAKIKPTIVHHSSFVGRDSECSLVISHVIGLITSCQKTKFIDSSAASIAVNSAPNVHTGFQTFDA